MRSTLPVDGSDDGWLLTVTTTRDGAASPLLVLDATDVAGVPVAAVTLRRGDLDWLVAADSSLLRVHQHGASARRWSGHATTRVRRTRFGAA